MTYKGLKWALCCVEFCNVDEKIRCAEWLEVSQASICGLATCADICYPIVFIDIYLVKVIKKFSIFNMHLETLM